MTKPSTAECNLEHYTLFLLSEPKHRGRCRLGEMFENVSHDSVNRLLLREKIGTEIFIRYSKENHKYTRRDFKCR